MNSENTKQTLPEGRVSKIVQVHPSLRCNLFCKHCYSSSAPNLKEGLAVRSILSLLEQAKEIGYNVVSLSGGEPFLYGSLEQLVQEASGMGYFNSITTNGMLLQSASAMRVLRYVNLIAISIDGREEQHDELRGFHGAYRKMMEGVFVIQDKVDKFGFIHTVQPNSWQLFPWLAALAIEKGAALLHLHPLELAGRANEYFGTTFFTPEDLYKTYITHYYLQTYYREQLFIQLDLLHRDHIQDNPMFCFHASEGSIGSLDSFSCLFRELIIDEQGDILPIAHGCSKRFRIGNIEETLPLSDMIDRFMDQQFTSLMKVYHETYEEIMANKACDIFNWSERVIKNTHLIKEEIVLQ
jgi:MoaA/NifB/PqqE/SkfB family radical SAM enzyme